MLLRMWEEQPASAASTLICKNSVALRNQYSFISFHSVLFQLSVDWKISFLQDAEFWENAAWQPNQGFSSSDKGRGVASFYFPTFLSLVSSQCDSPRDSIQTLLPPSTPPLPSLRWPLKHPCRGFLQRGGGGESLALSDRSPTAEAFVTRLLALWTSQVASDLTSNSERTGGHWGPSRRKKMKGRGKLARKGSEWRKGWGGADGVKQSVQK